MTTYSTYEAKARFSEVLRMVRQGHSVAITYRGEPVAEIRPIDGQGGSALERRLAGFDRLLSSNLLEAEVRAALRREEVRAATRHEARKAGDDLLSWVDWVIPSRPLSQEIRAVLASEYLRGTTGRPPGTGDYGPPSMCGGAEREHPARLARG